VTAELTAAGLAVALGDLALIIACWKSRTVLGGLLGTAGMPLVGFAIVRGASGGASVYSIATAALALAIGSVLYVLGQALERLLDDEHDVN
jgi:hypothetical protein